MTTHPYSSSRLAQLLPAVVIAGFPAARGNKFQCTSAFQDFVCIMFASIQQAKVTHTAKSSFEGLRNGFHLLIEETAMPQ